MGFFPARNIVSFTFCGIIIERRYSLTVQAFSKFRNLLQPPPSPTKIINIIRMSQLPYSRARKRSIARDWGIFFPSTSKTGIASWGMPVKQSKQTNI